jgi:predicted nucleic acid-binding OB-fold protein
MEYVRLSDLKKVPGIGEKTMERIRETCEIHRFEQSDKKNIDLSKWLDDIFEGL